MFSSWRERADLFEYHVVINGKHIATVLRENVDFFEQAFSINIEDCIENNLQYQLPFKIEVFGVEDVRGPSSTELETLGKRKTIDNMSAGASKRARTVTSAKEILRGGGPRKLYSDTIYTIKEHGIGSDRSGRIKIIAKPTNSGGPQTVMICAIYCTLHGAVFLSDTELIQPVIQRNRGLDGNLKDPCYGLKDYTICLTIRDIMTKEVLFQLQRNKQNCDRVDSPFRQTVAIQFVSPFIQIDTELVRYNLENFRDSLRMVGDLSIFDCNNRLFCYRSAFMWLDSRSGVPMVSSSMLVPPTEHGGTAIQFQVFPGRTEIRSCTVSIALAKIGNWFEQRTLKVLPVSKTLIDNSPKPENPLDIFLP